MSSFAENLWEPLSLALSAAKKDARPIFVSYYADWCVPCQVMDKNVFEDSTIVSVLKNNFHPVKLNVDSEEKIFCEGKKLSTRKCFYETLNLRGIPSFVVLASDGMSVLSFSGAFGTDGMLLFLQKILHEGFRAD